MKEFPSTGPTYGHSAAVAVQGEQLGIASLRAGVWFYL